MNNLVHIWRILGIDKFYDALNSIAQDPAFSTVLEVLKKAVIQETLTFMGDTPHAAQMNLPAHRRLPYES